MADSRLAWVDRAITNEAAKGRYTPAEIETALAGGMVYAVLSGNVSRLLYARWQYLDSIEAAPEE